MYSDVEYESEIPIQSVRETPVRRRKKHLIFTLMEYFLAWQFLYHASPMINQFKLPDFRVTYEQLKSEYERRAAEYTQISVAAPPRVSQASVPRPAKTVQSEHERRQPAKLPPLPPCEMRKKVVRAALSYVGSPYRFGGTDRRGIDCSALVQNSFREVGINLPRTAALQYGEGVFVPQNRLTPGDLVFFQTTRPGVSHVGVYLGERKFVHATSSGRVRTNSLDESYYRTRFVGAKTILG